MSRYPRHVVPGTPIHITQRGVDRCTTFITEDDFARYLWMLRSVSVTARCAVHAYVLMTNHLHLLVTPADAAAPANMMRALGGAYVRYFNGRHRRTGTLWEGRFRSATVDTADYFLACSRYIERNPQRAGLVDDPGAYAWSSFRGNGYGEYDPVITPHPLYTALGEDAETRCAAYRRLFGVELSPSTVAAVRTEPCVRRTMPATNYQQALAAQSGTSTETAAMPIKSRRWR